MTAPLQNTCGTQQNDAAASEKGFRVFSLGNTGLGHIGDFQIICAQYVRLAWQIQAYVLVAYGAGVGLDSMVKSRGLCGSFWCCLCLCGTQGPRAQVLPSGEDSGFLSGQVCCLPGDSCVIVHMVEQSYRKLILSSLWSTENEDKPFIISPLSSLPAAVVAFGAEGTQPWPALQSAGERGAHADLGVLQSPHIRGTEHRLNRVPCSVMYPMCSLGQDT